MFWASTPADVFGIPTTSSGPYAISLTLSDSSTGLPLQDVNVQFINSAGG
jgi:hypothetical protein